MIYLAHRGWWKGAEEKNSMLAFRRAFEAGYGVETDIRDHNGKIVIAHDLPTGDGYIPLEDFLHCYTRFNCPGALALNVKADGLQVAVAKIMAEFRINNAFFFDMAVPDALGYLNLGFETFTRHSEIEPEPAFYDRAHGVWIDCFLSDWAGPNVIEKHLVAKKKVALVSPELHRRPHRETWEKWKSLSSDVMICTDYPSEAEIFFR